LDEDPVRAEELLKNLALKEAAAKWNDEEHNHYDGSNDPYSTFCFGEDFPEGTDFMVNAMTVYGKALKYREGKSGKAKTNTEKKK
jgi:hypothetical protein